MCIGRSWHYSFFFVSGRTLHAAYTPLMTPPLTLCRFRTFFLAMTETTIITASEAAGRITNACNLLCYFFLFVEICLIRMCDAEFHYTYEYQGNASKLVHTPLTDKCYLTLTQGMHMGLGGNPYGPAGTGKTESVKALGGLFGRQVLVFNCDEVCSC